MWPRTVRPLGPTHQWPEEETGARRRLLLRGAKNDIIHQGWEAPTNQGACAARNWSGVPFFFPIPVAVLHDEGETGETVLDWLETQGPGREHGFRRQKTFGTVFGRHLEGETSASLVRACGLVVCELPRDEARPLVVGSGCLEQAFQFNSLPWRDQGEGQGNTSPPALGAPTDEVSCMPSCPSPAAPLPFPSQPRICEGVGRSIPVSIEDRRAVGLWT